MMAKQTRGLVLAGRLPWGGTGRLGGTVGTWLDKIRHGSHTLGANKDPPGKEEASAEQQVDGHGG